MTEINYSKIRDDNADKFSKHFSDYKRKNCSYHDSNIPTCNLSENKIIDISYFLTSVLTKCPSTNISLQNIKETKIIGRGTYGYGLSVGDKIVKIIICEKTINDKLLKEIEYNKIITNSGNEYFIKLLGYFIKDTDIYKYYDNSDNFENIKCFTSKSNLDKLCEIYLILEKADSGEVYDYFKTTTFENYTNSSYDILNMYTINKYFININKQIFIHCDLKADNIVVSSNKFKIIDFGMAFVSDKFFTEHKKILTIYKYLYTSLKNTDKLYISPFYDILCLTYTFWSLSLKKYYTMNYDLFTFIRTNIDEYIKVYPDEIINILFKLLNICRLAYEVHIFFYNLQEFFTDKKYLNDFVDIRMIKFIYDKIFNRFELHNFPLYISTGDKLNDDYKYFDNIMKFMKNIDYRYTLYDLEIREYDEILISYIETRKFDEKYLYGFINIMRSRVLCKKIIEHILITYPSYVDDSNNNSLHYAIMSYVSQSLIDNLIEKVDINNINKNGNTVLYDAIIMKNIAIIKKLLDKNIDINIISGTETMLYLCIKNNILNGYILTKLMEKTTTHSDLTLFPTVISINYDMSIDLIEKILDKFDLNFKDDFGDNILMKLITNLTNSKFDDYNTYIYLLINKININSKNYKNESCLELILLNNDLNKKYKIILIEKLIDKGINTVNKDLMDTSTLILAINNKLPSKLIEKFINSDTINVLETYTRLNALIKILIIIGNNSDHDYTGEIIKKLLDNGIDKKYVLSDGRTALSYALYTKNIDIIKLVCEESIINTKEVIPIKNLDYNELNNFDSTADTSVTILDRALDAKNSVNVFGLLLLHNANLLKRHVIKIVNKFTINECIELFKINFKNNKDNIMNLKLNLKMLIDKYVHTYKEKFDKYVKLYEKYRTIRKELKKI